MRVNPRISRREYRSDKCGTRDASACALRANSHDVLESDIIMHAGDCRGERSYRAVRVEGIDISFGIDKLLKMLPQSAIFLERMNTIVFVINRLSYQIDY